MSTGVERNARTAADIRLHAEYAASHGQIPRVMFNNLEKRTSSTLSPETRLFAEVCYEQKLVECVSTALIECTKSDDGRERARLIANAETVGDLRTTWKPLIDGCSKLLRDLKLDNTSGRLTRLSDLWSKPVHGAEQARRLRVAVQYAVAGTDESIGRAQKCCKEIIDWIELYSVPDSMMVSSDKVEVRLSGANKHIAVVGSLETFAVAETFLQREIEKESTIYVIVGNEDDGVRFYRRVCDKFPRECQLIWKEKKYGKLISPKVIIGNIVNFLSDDIEQLELNKRAVVFLHSERFILKSHESDFRPGRLNEFLAEIFVLTSTTFEHSQEMYDAIQPEFDLAGLIHSWPTEYQIFNADDVTSRWKRVKELSGRREFSLTKHHFVKCMREYILLRLNAKSEEIKVPSKLQVYVNNKRSSFVRAALAARVAIAGQDYVLYAERSNGTVQLRIRLKRQVLGGYGLQQFLEMRHGCAITPYRVPSKWVTATSLMQRYNKVLIIARSNPFRKFRDLMSYFPSMTVQEGEGNPQEVVHTVVASLDFTKDVCDEVKYMLEDYLVVVVCSTIQILLQTYSQLKVSSVGHVCICETVLGISNEALNHRTGTLIVCTTAVCFEGWAYLPRQVRKNLRIYVGHDAADNAALEAAFDLAQGTPISSFMISSGDSSMEQIYTLNAGREPSCYDWRAYCSSPATGLISICKGKDTSDSEELLVERYRKNMRISQKGDINDLLAAKRILHGKVRRLCVHTKMVSAQLKNGYTFAVDSPTDMAKDGFLEQARSDLREIAVRTVDVNTLLSSHAKNRGFYGQILDAKDLNDLAIKYGFTKEDLDAFICSIRDSNKPESWLDLRKKIGSQANIPYDADEHWEKCYDELNEAKLNAEDFEYVIALSQECVSAATSVLLQLRKWKLPKNYRQLKLQRSDRNLEDCSLYVLKSESSTVSLQELGKGASVESFMLKCSARSLHQPATNLEAATQESAASQFPLYVFPRRAKDRLARDLFDSAFVICDDYTTIEKNMHAYDLMRLPIILSPDAPSDFRRRLETESALMEYGSLGWMLWLARRLRFEKCNPEIARFYHESIARLDYCVEDDKLIQRFAAALHDPQARKPEEISSTERLRMDAFVYGIMADLQSNNHIVTIDPPFRSNEALAQLTHFIRSRRMPPVFQTDIKTSEV